MAPKGLYLVTAAAALSSVSAIQVPLQLPFEAPKLSWPSWTSTDEHASTKPLVDTKALQDSISSDKLFSRAKELYEIAKLAEDEYNHPTRVIGSDGESSHPQ